MALWLKKRAVTHALIAVLFVLPTLLLLSVDPERDDSFLSKARRQFDAWEYSSVDDRVRFGRVAPINPEIVFLTIDSSSMSVSTVMDEQTVAASRPLSLMQSYPFSRELYALICDKLFAAGARVVALDLFFADPTPNDQAFQLAIDRYRDKVVIGMNFSDDPLSGNSSTLTLPSVSLFPEQNALDDRLAFLNFWPDSDGVVRKAQYRTNLEQVNHLIEAEKLPAFYSFAARIVQKAGQENPIPNDLTGRMMRFAGPPLRSFKHHSLYEIFVPHLWTANFENGEAFRGKIVLIGPQGDLDKEKDKLPTSYGDMDGAEIQLNAVNALIQNDFLHPLSNFTTSVFVIGSGIIAYLLAMGIASIAWRFVTVLLVLVSYGVAVMLSFNGPGLLLPMVAPVGLLGAMTGTGFIYDFVLNQMEKLRLRTTFERYTSPNVARYLLDHSDTYREMLSGTRTKVTVLFSDVRGFTTMSEKSDSQELMMKLNEYLTAMVACVFRHDGSLDKFIGDAVMAVWGNTPYNFGPKEDAVRAVKAAMAMMSELRLLNAKWVKEGGSEWQVGIGLNHGEVIVGDMGSPQRKEFAVIGDAVNLASRLESLTKEFHVDILLGETVADLVRDQFHLRTVQFVQVAGKTEPVRTFTVVAEKVETLPVGEREFLAVYEQAILAFRDRRFNEARELLTQALKLQPDDHLAQGYLANCEIYIRTPPDASWSGVQVMTKK